MEISLVDKVCLLNYLYEELSNTTLNETTV